MAKEAAKEALEKFLEVARQRFHQQEKNHFTSLGFRVTEIEAGRAVVTMPYQPQFAGDPFTGAMASGPISALLDSCCAYAAATVKDPVGFSPTLDLRIDHVRIAKAGEDLVAEAEAYHVSEHVLFTRGVVKGEGGRPVAYALANFTPISQPILPESE